jgi:histidinol-phosphate aminotransferase
LIFLANPNNPTGTWVGREALRRFLAAVPGEVLVVLDEAYFEYMEDPDYPDGLALMREFSNLAVTRTFSKIYGLAGLRVGYAVTAPALADLLNRVRQPFNVNSLGLVAAEVALAEQNYVAESRRLNRAGLAQLEVGLTELGLAWIPTQCNFLCVDMGRDAGPLYDALLRQGVIVRPIGGYGMPRHLRITVGTEAENARCLQALRTLGDA